MVLSAFVNLKLNAEVERIREFDRGMVELKGRAQVGMIGKNTGSVAFCMAGWAEVFASIFVINCIFEVAHFATLVAVYEVIGKALRTVEMSVSFFEEVVAEVITAFCAGIITLMVATVADAIGVFRVIVDVNATAVVYMYGVSAVFTDSHTVDAGRAEVFVIVAKLGHFGKGMFFATVGTGNEGNVVVIVISMGCKGHFESLLSMIVRECVLY